MLYTHRHTLTCRITISGCPGRRPSGAAVGGYDGRQIRQTVNGRRIASRHDDRRAGVAGQPAPARRAHRRHVHDDVRASAGAHGHGQHVAAQSDGRIRQHPHAGPAVDDSTGTRSGAIGHEASSAGSLRVGCIAGAETAHPDQPPRDPIAGSRRRRRHHHRDHIIHRTVVITNTRTGHNAADNDESCASATAAVRVTQRRPVVDEKPFEQS